MNNTIPLLQKGDLVAIVAPAGIVKEENIRKAIPVLESWGLQVVMGKHIFDKSQVFAGDDPSRIEDFQRALDDTDVKAILCARGGYGSVRIIDQLDFSTFVRHPKWIVGFSDITVFHSHILRNFQLPTLHACMPNSYYDCDPGVLDNLHKALFTSDIVYQFPTHKLSRAGATEGIVTGGNLSILYNLRGTPSAVDFKDKILFIEDIGEHYYHLDRMMQAFLRDGQLANLNGLIVGQFSEMKDGSIPFGKSAEEIIFEAVRDYNYPIAFNFMAGHIRKNFALRLGAPLYLSVNQMDTIVSFS